MGEGVSGSKGRDMLGTRGPTIKNNGEYGLAGANNYYVALVNMFLSTPKEGVAYLQQTRREKLPLHPHEIARLQTCAKRDGAPPSHSFVLPVILDRRIVAVPADSLMSPCIQMMAKKGSQAVSTDGTVRPTRILCRNMGTTVG